MMHDDSLTDVVYRVLELKGLDVLLHSSVFIACVSDIAEQRFQREVKVLSRNLDDSMLSVLFEGASKDGQSLRLAEGRFSCILRDECFISDEMALVISSNLVRAIESFLGIKQQSKNVIASRDSQHGSALDENRRTVMACMAAAVKKVADMKSREQGADINRLKVSEQVITGKEFSLENLKEWLDELDVCDMGFVGDCCYFGYWVEQNAELATELYRLGAEKGDPDCCYDLGCLLFEGSASVEKDYPKAAEWFQQAADNGHGYAAYAFGYCCIYGFGIHFNPQKAERYFSIADSKGIELAKTALENPRRAPCLLRKAIRGRFYKALNEYTARRVFLYAPAGFVRDEELVSFYQTLTTGQQQEIEQFHKWIGNLSAWDLGFLGDCCYFGRWAEEDAKLAMELYQLGARGDDADSCYALGYHFFQGDVTGEPNYVEAVHWFQLAERQGHGAAAYSLGYCYRHGLGVSLEKETAVHYFAIAGLKGIEAAKKALVFSYGAPYPERVVDEDRLEGPFSEQTARRVFLHAPDGFVVKDKERLKRVL